MSVTEPKPTIEQIEVWLGRSLPEPLRSFLVGVTASFIATNGRTLVYGLEAIIERNETYESKVYCPGNLMIGDDGGGTAIVLSLDDGKVYRVGMGVMSPDCFDVLSPSFADWRVAGYPFQTQ